ncbi:hypothetical protein JK628_23025 [Shewanella sp. KX20019]|uniref:hypothetical protein n=1 Tax=Shewanella sp. KX20019 TaxID=2803864 RepID=UPI001926ED36|nr:hypothetical protein [Shewanella sp. KX20019]QQX80298.1 hypothetical protein JK628_23025 [Shewanella sp. KX20019]
MNKREAIDLANNQYNASLTTSNTHFSNINQTKSVWWLEIPISKIKLDTLTDINLLLKDKQALHWLKVSTAFLKGNLQGFKVRDNKGVICLELDINTFYNIVGPARVSFKPFIQ